jgi:lipopolysaccharide export system protein LptA
MNLINPRTFIMIQMISLLAVIYANPAYTKTTQENRLIQYEPGSIVVRSDSFEIDNTRHVVIFTGNVEAVRDDININCQKIELYYENLAGDDEPEKGRSRVLEIIATDQVVLSRPDGGTATAEKAVYYQNEEKVVLTGKPVIKQGADFMEGSKITLFLKEGKSLVESSEDSKAKAVLFPHESE